MQEPDPGKRWLFEKTCLFCNRVIGHGKFRPKKLHCYLCLHAVCPACSTESPQGTICRKCSRDEPRKPGTSSVMDLGRLSLAGSDKSLGGDAYVSVASVSPRSDTDQLDYKQQLQWYSDQLTKRDGTIAELSSHIVSLSATNDQLRKQIAALEGTDGRANACFKCDLL